MKKTLIASAVAAAALSSNAFAMDPASDLAEMLESMPTFYGNIQLAHVSAETDGVAGEASEHELYDNGSTFGIKHEHAISEDLTGFFKAEFHFDADDKAEESLGEEKDESYIGVKGGFGSVQVGSDDTVYEWVDIMDMYEAVGLEGDLAAQKEGDNVQYVSPEIAGGLTVGVTYPIDSDTTFGGAIAAKYVMDNIEIVASYGIGREEGGVDADDAIGLAGSIGLGDFTVSAQYEMQDDDAGDITYYGLMGQYAMGANNFALGYQMVDNDADEEETGIYVQALHNMSDNMYVYLEYLMQDDVGGVSDEESDILAVGATYAF